MTDFVGKAAWDIECPHCSQKFKTTLAELEKDPLLTCQICGGEVQIDTHGTGRQAADAVRKVEKSWDNLQATIGKRR